MVIGGMRCVWFISLGGPRLGRILVKWSERRSWRSRWTKGGGGGRGGGTGAPDGETHSDTRRLGKNIPKKNAQKRALLWTFAHISVLNCLSQQWHFPLLFTPPPPTCPSHFVWTHPHQVGGRQRVFFFFQFFFLLFYFIISIFFLFFLFLLFFLLRTLIWNSLNAMFNIHDNARGDGVWNFTAAVFLPLCVIDNIEWGWIQSSAVLYVKVELICHSGGSIPIQMMPYLAPFPSFFAFFRGNQLSCLNLSWSS